MFPAACSTSESVQPLGSDQQRRSDSAVQGITALGEMTGGIAHDFRNILAVIDSGLSLAERNIDDPAALRSCLLAAREGVARGLRLTARILTFTKKKDADVHADDVNELLENLRTFLRYGAGAGIRVEFSLTPHLPKCIVNPPQFNAAILNLVVNARDAMPDGGVITISTSIADEPLEPGIGTGAFVRVSVTDRGRGMAREVVERIFDPYFTTKGESGTGLGLPQVSACMKQIGGLLKVTSGIGVGTTFDLLFPASDEPPEQALPAKKGQSATADLAASEPA